MKLVKVQVGSVIFLVVLTLLLAGCKEKKKISKEKAPKEIISQQVTQKSDCQNKGQVFKGKISKKTISQERAEKFHKQATDLYKKTTEMFDKELLIINSEKDKNKIKKSIGKIIENKQYPANRIEEFFFGEQLADRNLPFVKYWSDVRSAISALNKMCRKLKKFQQNTDIQNISKQIVDLIDRLKEIRSYVETHREYRNQNRYFNDVLTRR